MLKKLPESLVVEGVSTPVKVSLSARAKRATLTVSRVTGRATLTLPPKMPFKEARAFVDAHRNWLATRVNAAPDAEPFRFDMVLPFRGDDMRVVPRDGRGVRVGDGEIRVAATDDALPRVLERWLREQARMRLYERSMAHAQTLGVAFSKLSVKDTRSRWGSCSSAGALSYSWRVILAPDEALDYLAAHEVAHLREMNHSARFWAHVERLCPDYQAHRDWFRAYAAELHRYGRE